MGTFFFTQRLVFLLSFLLHLNPSLPYSLKNCSIDYSEDASAELSLDCSNHKLVSVPDDVPRDASSLKLNYNRLEQIEKDDFSNMSKLKVLLLNNNLIAHVDDGSFIHLVALTKLDMDRNKLTNLTSNFFRGLSNLTELSLRQNNIQFIDESAFDFLTSLETVVLDDNNLRHIADLRPILQLPNIQSLNITSNLFSSFETKDLQLNASSGLKMLDVSSNVFEKFSITTPVFLHLEEIHLINFRSSGVKWDIPDKTLLTSITRLYLSQNVIHFKELEKVLQSLDSLTHLTLMYMTKSIKKGLLETICKIPTLKRLELFFNRVANLSAKLVNCSQLSELDLSSTSMTELSEGSIRNMERLRFLNLETNFLTKVPGDIKGVSSLEILNLGDNLISELGCEDFTNTTLLRELYLHINRIAILDSCVFENLTQLKVLDLSNNLLWKFDGAFKTGPQNLEFLDLTRNFILILKKGDFQGLRSLKYLDVVSQHIGRVKPRAFDGLKSLATLRVALPLDFENNFRGLRQLESLTVYFKTDFSFKSPHANDSETFTHLKSLKTFTIICQGYHSGLPFDVPPEYFQVMRYLENFRAENVYISAPPPDTFQFTPQLKNLSIVQTDLSDLGPELFELIPNLQALDLSQTKLSSLDFLGEANLSELRRLKLSDNEITAINETAFQSLPALTYLDLSGNPFTCDCSNAGFIQWAKSNNQTQVVDGHQYTCAFPPAEQGNKLLDFDIQSCWMDVGFLCFLCSSSLTLLTLLASFVYHFLRWQLAYAFYLFLAFLYDSRRKKRAAPQQYDAFVSYNVRDEAWVYREMLPVLEGEQGWRLCLHHRDFQPGKPIIENITDAIYSSRKTICVISRHYLQSEWCSREIQMASFRLFDEQKDVLVLLFLEELASRQLSPYYRMRKLLKRRTYLSWPQAGQHPRVFWQNVRRALQTEDAATETDILTGPAAC